MKTSLSFGLGGVFGFRSSNSALTGLSFAAPLTAMANKLRAAFTAARPGNQVISGTPDLRFVRSARSGAFSLDQFRRVVRPPAQPQGQVVPQGGQGPGHAPLGVVQAPQRLTPEGAQANITAIGQRADTSLTAWSAQERSEFLAGRKSGQGERRSVFHRSEAMQVVKTGLAELRNTEFAAGGPDAPGELPRQFAEARLALAQKAVVLACPGMLAGLKTGYPGPEGSEARDIAALASSLLRLDDLLRPFGDAGHDINRLMALLAQFARNSELANSPLGPMRASGIVGMTAIAETILEAVAPPRDGSALNSLLGIDAELDKALSGARQAATERVMLSGLALRRGCTVEELEATDRQQATADARQVVQQDLELARTRQQFRVAMQQAGILFTLTGIGGIRADSALVVGLRDKLGANAQQIGVVVAGLMLLEQKALENPASERLRGDIAATLQAAIDRRPGLVEAQNAGAGPEPLRELDDEIRFLTQRRDSLTREDMLSEARLTTARDNLLTLQRSRLTKVAELQELLRPGQEALDGDSDAWPELEQRMDSLDADIKGLNERIQMNVNAVRYWEERTSSNATRKEVATGRQELDAARRDLALAEGGDRTLPETAATIERATEAVERATVRLQEAERSVHDSYGVTALTGGLTEAEIRKLGLSDQETREVAQTARDLAKQGLRSADQAATVARAVNKVIAELGGKRFSGDAATSEMLHPTGTNEERAQRLGDILVQNITGEVALKLGSQDIATKMRTKLEGQEDSPGLLAAVANGPDSPNRLSLDRYAELQRDMLVHVDTIADIDLRHAECVQALRGFNLGKVPAPLDPEKPAGLAVARRVLEATTLLRMNGGTMAGASASDRERFTVLCDALRGFDVNSLSVPFWQFRQPALTESQVAALAGNAPLLEAANAIVFLRETEPAMRREAEQAASETLLEIDAVIDARVGSLGAAFRPVRDATRAAILAQLAATPATKVDQFCPADHAEAIKGRLTSWGVDIARFTPEINVMLSQSFGAEELNLWVRSTRLTDNYVQAAENDAQARTTAIAERDKLGGLKPETKAALLQGIDRLTSGTKLKLTVGDRVEMQTGSIPVEPSGILGVNVKVGIGQLANLEIARGGDGYEMIVRHGWDGKGGAELQAKLWGSGALGLKAEATAGFEAAGYRVSGVSLRFPPTEAGRQSMKAVLETIVTKGEIAPRDLARVQELLPVVETKGGGRLAASARAGFDPASTSWGANDVTEYATARARVRAMATVGATQMGSSYSNTNMVITKKEREYTAEFAASVAINLKVGVPMDNLAGKHQAASTDILDATVSTTFVYKSKGKEVRGADGAVQATTELVRQMYLPPVGGGAAVRAMGGEALRRVLDDDALPAQAKADIATLIAAAGTGDMVSVTFALDERVRGRANELLAAAKALREGRTVAPDLRTASTQADDLEEAAQALLDDEDNYNPSRFQLLPTNETQAQLSPINLIFAKWVAYTEAKTESVALEVRLDAALSARVRSELSEVR